MIFYGQRDKNWASDKLGNTNYTIGGYGCTTCCIADAASWFGIIWTPKGLAKKLDYNYGGYIIWQSLAKIGLKLENRFRKYDKAVIDEALRNPRTIVMLNVNFGAHWVFALKRLGFGTYWVHDPLTNSKKIYRGVVGGAVLSRI